MDESAGVLSETFFNELLRGTGVSEIDPSVYAYVQRRYACRILFRLADRFGLEISRGLRGVAWAEFFVAQGRCYLRPPLVAVDAVPESLEPYSSNCA